MRKKTIINVADNFMWYLIYLLPLVALLILLAKNGATDFSIADTFTSLGLDIFVNNPVLTNLSSIFGENGILPFFVSNDILIYMSYFICVFIIHLFVDFLLFIPRLAHKWMNKFSGGDI